METPPPDFRHAPSDQSTVRRSNLALTLQYLRHAGPRSRADVAAGTGLNKATVSSLVAELVLRGLVRETGERHEGAIGRPARILELDGTRVGALGLEANVDYLAAYGIDLAGRVLVNRRIGADVSGMTPEVALAALARLAETSMAEMSAAGADLAGVGVAVPGLVDVGSGSVLFAPNLGWRDVPVARRLSGALGLGPSTQMMVDNDANLSALAEFREGAEAGVHDLVYLTGEVGVGGGIIVDGRLLRGAYGFGGEVGHMAVDPTGEFRCGCGRYGCWETRVGLAALLRQAMPDSPHGAGGALRDPEERVAEVLQRADSGDRRTLEALQEIGRWLGIGASILVNLFNPRAIVLGGYFSRVTPYLLPSAVEQLDGHSIAAVGLAGPAPAVAASRPGARVDVPVRSATPAGPGAGRSSTDPTARTGGARVRVVASQLGFTAAVRGGAAMAVDAVLADPTRIGSVDGGTR